VAVMTHTRALAGSHVRAVARGLQAASHRVGVARFAGRLTSSRRWTIACACGDKKHMEVAALLGRRAAPRARQRINNNQGE
jgi:hypothetical protein